MCVGGAEGCPCPDPDPHPPGMDAIGDAHKKPKVSKRSASKHWQPTSWGNILANISIGTAIKKASGGIKFRWLRIDGRRTLYKRYLRPWENQI